jgi:hypothetical protein
MKLTVCAVSLIILSWPSEGKSAGCLTEPIQRFDVRELQSPFRGYSNGTLRLRVKNYSVGDDSAYINIKSNMPEFDVCAPKDHSLVEITALHACVSSVTYIVSRFGFQNTPCPIAENTTPANLKTYLRVPSDPIIAQDGFTQNCRQTSARDNEQVERVPEISRMMPCRMSGGDSCASSRCDDIRILLPAVNSPTPSQPKIVASLEDGQFTVKNVGAAVRDRSTEVFSIIYAGLTGVPMYGNNTNVTGEENLVLAARTPGVRYDTGDNGQLLFSIDLKSVHDRLQLSSRTIQETAKLSKVELSQYVCVDLGFTDPLGSLKHSLFSLRMFNNVALRIQDMHENELFYKYCKEDFDKWIGYPTHVIEDWQRSGIARAIIAYVNQPSPNTLNKIDLWNVEHLELAGSKSYWDTASLRTSNAEHDFHIIFTCNDGELTVGLGLWSVGFGKQPEREKEFSFLADGTGVKYRFHLLSSGGYQMESREGVELLKVVLRSNPISLSFDALEKAFRVDFDTTNASVALDAVIQKCSVPR